MFIGHVKPAEFCLCQATLQRSMQAFFGLVRQSIGRPALSLGVAGNYAMDLLKEFFYKQPVKLNATSEV